MTSFADTSVAESPEEILQNLQKLIVDINACKAYVAPDLVFKYTPSDGIGVYTQNALAPGNVLMKIPFTVCLSVDMVMCDPNMKKVLDETPSLLNYPDEVLAMAIMYAASKDVTCEWATHTRTFPRDLNTTIYWSEEELLELKDCNVFHLTRMMKAQMNNDWETIHQPLSEQYPDILGKTSKDLYVWALSIVYSRALGIIRKGKYVRIIPPVLDMANHSNEGGNSAADTFHYDDECNEIMFTNAVAREEGEECFAVYGTYPNSKLAYTYGFASLSAPYRAIDLWTRLTPAISNYEEKQKILNTHALTRHQAYDFEGTIRDNFISAALMATVRVIQATEDELPIIENAYKGSIVSVRNELASYAALRSLLIIKMKPEQAEADRELLGEMLLNTEDMSDRKLTALIIRTEERELMQDALAMVDGFISQLQQDPDLYVPPDAPKAPPAGAAEDVKKQESSSDARNNTQYDRDDDDC